jgi:hypothetical protein
MPTATPFKALARGNGFNTIVKELAVEPVDGNLGITINDYNAAYATWNGGNFSGLSNLQAFSQPFSNLKDAEPFWWNSYSLEITADLEFTQYGENLSNSIDGAALNQSVEYTPAERVNRPYPSPFTYNSGGSVLNLFFNGLYYYGNGTNRKYYWGLVGTTNIQIVSGANFAAYPRIYERRNSTSLTEYDPFILTITSTIKLAMAHYSTNSEVTDVDFNISVDSVNYYTY